MKRSPYHHRIWPKSVLTLHNMTRAIERGELDVHALCDGQCPRNLVFDVPLKLLSAAVPPKRYTLIGKHIRCPVRGCRFRCNVMVKISNLPTQSISVHEPPPYWKLG